MTWVYDLVAGLALVMIGVGCTFRFGVDVALMVTGAVLLGVTLASARKQKG